jgi:hypothetical protein
VGPGDATPFPFVVGRGRSGTTLVRAILDSHPDMAVPDETHLIVRLGRRRQRYERASGFDVDTFMDDLGRRRGFDCFELDEPVVRADLRADPPGSYPDAIRRVFALYAASRGKRRYADKTPIHVLNVPYLADLFPEARFVHVIRDGREVALSYLDVAWGPTSVADAALEWRRAVLSGRRAGSRLGPSRYLEVRYERLVDDTEATVRGLCDFLDLAFDPVMLRYHERADEVAGKMGMPDARQALYRPLTRGLRDWRTQIPVSDVALFEALAGDVLDELGYERVAGRPSARLRLGAVRHQVAAHASRVGRAARRARGAPAVR